jgi:hypothetical protein
MRIPLVGIKPNARRRNEIVLFQSVIVSLAADVRLLYTKAELGFTAVRKNHSNIPAYGVRVLVN